MPSRKLKATIDPELTRQISTAGAAQSPIEAVVMLRQSPSQIAAHPEQTEALANKILERVTQRVGSGLKDHNVLKNLGTVIVAAAPHFMHELIMQPEVASAVANRQPEEAATQPVKPRPVASPRRKTASSKKAKSAKARP